MSQWFKCWGLKNRWNKVGNKVSHYLRLPTHTFAIIIIRIYTLLQCTHLYNGKTQMYVLWIGQFCGMEEKLSLKFTIHFLHRRFDWKSKWPTAVTWFQSRLPRPNLNRSRINMRDNLVRDNTIQEVEEGWGLGSRHEPLVLVWKQETKFSCTGL